MKRKVFWKSWSQQESAFELENIKTLPLNFEWVNGYSGNGWNVEDIWLTTNGNEYLYGARLPQVSWFAESFYYLQPQYCIYDTDKRFNLRLHFNPNFCKQQNTKPLSIFGWWNRELAIYEETVKNKKADFTFGMVLGKKPPKQGQPPCYFGWIRDEIVKAAVNRSFRYYGYGWSHEDKNYGGEIYMNGQRSSPIKFTDARNLMTKAKFVFATENTHDDYYSMNYMTEKIFHGFLAAAVPIYAGAWNIGQMIDPSLFIDMRKFDYDLVKIMDYCEKMPENEYQGYLSRIGDFLRKQGQQFTGEQTFMRLDRILCDNF